VEKQNPGAEVKTQKGRMGFRARADGWQEEEKGGFCRRQCGEGEIVNI
jgi:hypothetical protein